MDAICERCGCTITDTAGIVTVKIGKVHTICCLCWQGIEPRWHRVIRKHFPLQNLRIITAPYVHFDLPRWHCHPLPVTPADAAMA